MKVIAITGGIGAGKSTVRRMFEELGAFGIDADELARKVVEPGTVGSALLRDAFGAQFFDSEGNLDRKKMAAKVFSEPDARSTIEAILHPLIRESESQVVDDLRKKDPGAVIVVEIPLLAEVGRWKDYDGVVLVTAPESVRISRLVTAGRYDHEGALARIASQAMDAEREKLADWQVDNSQDPEETGKQVKTIYRKLVEDR